MLKPLHVMATSCLLIGCTSVGPDYQTPSASVQTSWQESGDARVKSDAEELREWWRVLADPVLDRLIDRALEQNLTLQQAALRIVEARAIRQIAKGQQFPQLQELRGDFRRTEVSENAPNAAFGDRTYGEWSVGFDVAWEVDLWGKFSRGVEAAVAELQASVADYDDLVVAVTAEVATVYVQMRFLERRRTIAEANVALQKESLRIAQARLDAGAVTELDVAQARSLLLRTQAAIPTFDANIREARNALSVLLGLPPSGAELGLEASEPTIPDPPTDVATGMPADLLRRRPDIRRAERLAAAQCARIGIAKADLYPALSLVGSVGLLTGDSTNAGTRGDGLGDLFEASSFTGTIGPSVSLPILNYGRITNDVRAQDSRFQQLILNYQDTVLRAAQEVEDSLVRYLRAQERAEFLAGSVTASKRALDLAETQYQNGAVDFQRVLDTQRSLALVEDELATAQSDVALFWVATYKALGGGWELTTPRTILPDRILDEMRARTNWGTWLDVDEDVRAQGEPKEKQP